MILIGVDELTSNTGFEGLVHPYKQNLVKTPPSITNLPEVQATLQAQQSPGSPSSTGPAQ
jgi:hypothetical protein